jgi:ABC-type sugar transport system ATPase subunit
MYFGAKVLILDEPTSALGVKEASTVLRFINNAKSQGVGVVFITHNAHRAMSVGDHFVVLIQGRVAAWRAANRSTTSLANSPILDKTRRPRGLRRKAELAGAGWRNTDGKRVMGMSERIDRVLDDILICVDDEGARRRRRVSTVIGSLLSAPFVPAAPL